jgi:hypothetical protein
MVGLRVIPSGQSGHPWTGVTGSSCSLSGPFRTRATLFSVGASNQPYRDVRSLVAMPCHTVAHIANSRLPFRATRWDLPIDRGSAGRSTSRNLSRLTSAR